MTHHLSTKINSWGDFINLQAIDLDCDGKVSVNDFRSMLTLHTGSIKPGALEFKKRLRSLITK